MKRKLIQLSPEAIARAGASSALALDTSAVGASVSMLAQAPAESPKLGTLGRVDIAGPLAQKAIDGLCAYVDGYDAIAARLASALENSDGVLLVVDSPGGDVAGLESGVERMRAIRARHPSKPVHAYVDELAASAAYWVAACVADQITVPPAGRVGSIGVLSLIADTTEALAKEGVKVKVFREPAGKAESMSVSPLSELAEERTRETVKDAADRFFAAVADARGIEVKAIQAMNGALLRGQRAVESKLADAVGSIDEAAAGLGARVNEARAQREKEREMKLQGMVAALVGVSADAPGEVVETSLAKVAADVLASSGASKLSEVTAKIDALRLERDANKAAVAELGALKAQQAEAQKVHAAQKLAATLDAAVEAGKIPPADREKFAALAATHGQAWLDAVVETLPVIGASLTDVRRGDIKPSGSGQAGAPATLDPEVAMLLRATGQTVEDYQKAEALSAGRNA